MTRVGSESLNVCCWSGSRCPSPASARSQPYAEATHLRGGRSSSSKFSNNSSSMTSTLNIASYTASWTLAEFL